MSLSSAVTHIPFNSQIEAPAVLSPMAALQAAIDAALADDAVLVDQRIPSLAEHARSHSTPIAAEREMDLRSRQWYEMWQTAIVPALTAAQVDVENQLVLSEFLMHELAAAVDATLRKKV